MEKKINEGCRGSVRITRLSSLIGAGSQDTVGSPLPVEGKIFFLTFPFIEQAMSQACAFSSPFRLSMGEVQPQFILRMERAFLAPRPAAIFHLS
jgi:hypothetical protein